MKRAFLWAILFSAIAAVVAAFVLRSFELAQDQHEQTAPGTPLILPAPAGGLGVGPGSSSKDERIAAPSFSLTDQTGQGFDSASLQGKVWIADFIFTSCAGACPQMTARMAGLQSALPRDITLVSISVDPVRDTPSVLAEYAKLHGADPARWHFLTGPTETIAALVKNGFRLSYAEGTDPLEPVTHSSRFVLVNRRGAIHGYYDSTDSSQLEQLVRDAGTL